MQLALMPCSVPQVCCVCVLSCRVLAKEASAYVQVAPSQQQQQDWRLLQQPRLTLCPGTRYMQGSFNVSGRGCLAAVSLCCGRAHVPLSAPLAAAAAAAVLTKHGGCCPVLQPPVPWFPLTPLLSLIHSPPPHSPSPPCAGGAAA